MYVLAGYASQRGSSVGKRILVVDEDSKGRDGVLRLLVETGYQADGCPSWDAATALLSQGEHAVLVKDQQCGNHDSLALARDLTRSHPAVSVILLNAEEPSGGIVAALQAGVFDFMTRSFEPAALAEHLLDAVRRTFDAEAAHEAQKPGTLSLSKDPVAEVLVGECSGIVEARQRVRAALEDEAPVLLIGEAGTEKLVLARLLHESGTSAGPFVVASASRGEALGGSSGSDMAGTTFFSEVSSLDPVWQMELAKRLSVVDLEAPRARIIAGIGQVPASAWQGSTLARLFENAGCHRISLPPLRERGRDVLILAEHFAEQGRLALGDASLRIDGSAVDALTRYAWPGNVDELRFAIQHAASLCSSSSIQVEDLPPSVAFSLERPADESGTRLQVQSLEDMELAYILRVLDAVGGNKASAARLLGVDRTTLYRKLQRQEQAGVLSSEVSSEVQPSSRRVRK
jgi:two-component system, NtrC family, response regulator AtoC